MTRKGLVVGLCALTAVGVASAAPAPSNPPGKKAQLKVADTTPLIVRGAGFKAREHVRVIASTGTTSQTIWKTATLGGRFTAKFGSTVRACGSYRLAAVGSRGTRASVLPAAVLESAFPRRPEPDCAPSGTVVER